MAELKEGLPMVIDKNTKVLILGTFPGDTSIDAGEYYYDSKGNQFWWLLGQVVGSQLLELNYEEKNELLLSKKIGWGDVFHRCRREHSSSDNKIIDGELGDFRDIKDNYPNLKTIFINGKFLNGNNANRKIKDLYNSFKYEIEKLGFEMKELPSSSGTNTRMNKYEKLKCWNVIKEYIS